MSGIIYLPDEGVIQIDVGFILMALEAIRLAIWGKGGTLLATRFMPQSPLNAAECFLLGFLNIFRPCSVSLRGLSKVAGLSLNGLFNFSAPSLLPGVFTQ